MATFTKQAIFSSFMKFLNEKPLDRITVKDIVDDCGINRKTFYYYFQDIYALTDEMFRAHIEELRAKFPPEENSWTDISKAIAGYMYENRRAALHIFRTLGYEKIEGILYDICMEYLPNLIGRRAEGLEVAGEDTELILSCFSITVSGMLTRWLNDGMKTLPIDTVERFAALVEGISRPVLENASRLQSRKDGD